jgi:hypothetical protein
MRDRLFIATKTQRHEEENSREENKTFLFSHKDTKKLAGKPERLLFFLPASTAKNKLTIVLK